MVVYEATATMPPTEEPAETFPVTWQFETRQLLAFPKIPPAELDEELQELGLVLDEEAEISPVE